MPTVNCRAALGLDSRGRLSLRNLGRGGAPSPHEHIYDFGTDSFTGTCSTISMSKPSRRGRRVIQKSAGYRRVRAMGRLDCLPLIVFQGKLDNFAHSLHESVQIFRLGVATSQGRHGCDVVVLFISLDNNREFALSFHVVILARQRRAHSESRVTVTTGRCRAALGLDSRGRLSLRNLGRARAPVPT